MLAPGGARDTDSPMPRWAAQWAGSCCTVHASSAGGSSRGSTAGASLAHHHLLAPSSWQGAPTPHVPLRAAGTCLCGGACSMHCAQHSLPRQCSRRTSGTTLGAVPRSLCVPSIWLCCCPLRDWMSREVPGVIAALGVVQMTVLCLWSLPWARWFDPCGMYMYSFDSSSLCTGFRGPVTQANHSFCCLRLLTLPLPPDASRCRVSHLDCDNCLQCTGWLPVKHARAFA